MRLEHEIIRDLLPLYADGVCSAESRQAVEEHLAGCPLCRKEYETLKNADTFGAPAPEERQKAAALKKVRRALNWKRVLAVCLAVAVTVGVVTGARMWLNSATVKVPAEAVKNVQYLPDTSEGLETFNRITRETLERDGNGQAFSPYPREDFHGGIVLELQGKYTHNGINFTGAKWVGDRYVGVFFTRVTYWDAFTRPGPENGGSCILIPAGWEHWASLVLWQFTDDETRLYDENGNPVTDLETLNGVLPHPHNEDCIFDEIYYCQDCDKANAFSHERDPVRLKEMLDRMTADGDAVLIWQREP